MERKVKCRNCGCNHTLTDVVYGINIADFRCARCKMFNCFKVLIKKPQWQKNKEKTKKEKTKLFLEQYELLNKLKNEFGCSRAELLMGNRETNGFSVK